LGAAEAIYGLDRLYLELDAELDSVITAARTRIADPQFATAWAEGKAMSYREAVQYALSCGELGIA
jgi:hypothetical protein